MSQYSKAIHKAKEIYEENMNETDAIDLNKIAKKYDILLQEVDGEYLQSVVKVFNENISQHNISGLFISKNILRNDSAIILVNKDDIPNRQRFTIAHELGHYFLMDKPEGNIISVKLRSSDNLEHSELDEEKQANAFAAELLMPEIKVKSYIEMHTFRGEGKSVSKELLIDVADNFGVSIDAMKHRLKFLGYKLW